MLMVACAAPKSEITLLDAADFEATVNGAQTSLYTLKAGDLVMQVTNYGGRVVSLWVPDRDGNYADVEIGYENIDRYINNKGERFFGAAVGPVANRIANGKFTLEGKEYDLPKNNNDNTLHGGLIGIDNVVWSVKEVTENSLLLSCNLPDGQDGFPGNRTLDMRYTLTDNNEFVVTYLATTDAPTIMNPSHHSFFNLKGEGNGTVLDNILKINSLYTTPVDNELIPTGELAPVEGTPFDFNEPTVIGERINEENEQLKNGSGYDHNWVINRGDQEGVVFFADLYEPQSGRGMEVWSDQIAMQFYSGNFFKGKHTGKYGKPIKYREALALETQYYPDAPNHENFPSITLMPGEEYTQTCVYKFYVK